MHVSIQISLFHIFFYQIPDQVASFTPSPFISNRPIPHFLKQNELNSYRKSLTPLHLSQISPNNESSVGVVGRGFVFVLASKLAAMAGYNTWMLYPPKELEVIQSVMKIDDDEPLPANLDFVGIGDEQAVGGRLKGTDALILAVDSPDDVLSTELINFLINKETVGSLKRVVILSRNLNGKGMGFFVKAAKFSANSQIWGGDSEKIKMYQDYENSVKSALKKAGSEADVITVRAGTLKGGGCGEDPTYPQYLSKKFYEITKTDIITWNFLFDLKVRGVELSSGDNLPGPGVKAVFTATSSDVCEGDSSRCSVGDAMVKCLSVDSQNDVDFGVKTLESREPPTDDEWNEMLKKVMT